MASPSPAAPAATTPTPLPDISLPSRAEIDAVISPYVIRRMPADAAEWRRITGKLARKEHRRYLGRRLKQLLPSTGHARPQSLVGHHYETHWAKLPWPQPGAAPSNKNGIPCRWGDEGLLMQNYGRKRAHHLLFARVLEALRPETALEVGAGNGINLLVMSALFPQIAWTGIELTQAGVDVSNSVKAETELPTVLRDFAPLPVVDPTAHRRIDFRQGNATALSFPDKSFDLVFSFQALEQMQAVRDAAVAEMARVARRWVVLTEPLADFNQSPPQRHYMRARGYLDLATAELPRFGLRPLLTFGDLPQKVTLGVGLAVCAVENRT